MKLKLGPAHVCWYGGCCTALWLIQTQIEEQAAMQQDLLHCQCVAQAQEAWEHSLDWKLHRGRSPQRHHAARHPQRVPVCLAGLTTHLGVTHLKLPIGPGPLQVVDAHGRIVADTLVGLHGWQLAWQGYYFLITPPPGTQGTGYDIRCQLGYSTSFNVMSVSTQSGNTGAPSDHRKV